MIDFLTFEKVIFPSNFNSTSSGVEIFLDNSPDVKSENQLWIRGKYQIPVESAKKIDASILLKALVITCVFEGMSKTKNLLGSAMVFADDETTENNFRVGYFNYNIVEWVNIETDNKYYITVSLDKYISNTVSFNT